MMLRREVHLRNYIDIIRKYDFVIAISFLLVFGTALIVSLHLPKLYDASTLILVKPSSSSPTSSTNVFKSILSGGGLEQGEMETLKRRFTTESLLKSTIDELERQNIRGVQYLPSIGKLKKFISSEILPDTNFIKLSVKLGEQEGGERNAAILANALILQIQKIRSKKKDDKAKHRKKILEGKLTELKLQIAEKENELLNFTESNGIPTIWLAEFSKILDRRTKLIETRQQIESNKFSAELELKKLEQELEKHPQELVEYSKTVIDNPTWLEQVNKLIELEFQITDLKARVGEESAELKGLEAQRKEREKRLDEFTASKTSVSETEKRSPNSPIHIGLINRKIEVEIRIDRADDQIRRYDDRIREAESELESFVGKLPKNQFKFDRISKSLEVAYDISREVHSQMIAADVAIEEAGYEPSGIEVVDTAYPKKISVSPRVGFISAIAGIIGLAVGLTTAFMLEYFDNTYKTAEDAQFELGLDLLGVIPKSQSEKYLDRSSVIENYHIFASNLDFARMDKQSEAIMLTSSTRNEGKSSIIANLGMSMASANSKVLIVDADLRRGSQHEIFNLPSKPGLTDLLLPSSQNTANEIIQTTEVANLYLLATGSISSNPIELLSSHSMAELIGDLKESFDVILFDTPPLFPVADARILASKLDGCVLIADLDNSSRDTIARAKMQLEKVDINLLGLVCKSDENSAISTIEI